MDLSIIIPLYNEAESLPELCERIQKVCDEKGLSVETWLIDDGSKDQSWEIIEKLHAENPRIKGIRFMKNFGKSQALQAGFQKASGKVVITMDADLQDFPEEIPELYDLIHQEKYHLISGWKQKRKDPVFTKNMPSKLFNWAARKTSGIELHDFNCGLKAYDAEVIKNIKLRGNMHRYIPILAKNAGFEKITEKKVQHQARKYGESKFGSSRFINGFLDLITLSFINRFGNNPMRLFGALGTLIFFIGFISAFYIGAEKLYKTFYLEERARLVTDNPFFYIALTCILLGTQLFLAGFLGEILVRKTFEENNYHIKNIIE